MDNLIDKYLGFNVGDEKYGIPISVIRQVIRHTKIMPIHEESDFLKGVINLRGKIIPIIDMRAKFGMPEKEYDDRTVFIIVDIMTQNNFTANIGMVVDSVSDVVELSEDDVEKTPDMGLRLRQNYLFGIAKVGEGMMMILNIEKILSSNEITNIKGLEASQLEKGNIAAV